MGSRHITGTAGIMKGAPCVLAVFLSLLLAASHAAPGEMGPPPGQSPPHPDPSQKPLSPPTTTEAPMPSPPSYNDGNVHWETIKAGEHAASEMVAEGKKAIEKANEVMEALEKELKNQQEKSESSAYSYRK